MEALRILSWFSPLIALVLGWRYRRFTLLWMYCLFGLLVDTISYFLYFVWKIPSNTIPNTFNLFLLIELVVFGLFFYRYLFKRNALFGWAVVVVALIFVVQTIVHSIYVQNQMGSVFLLLCYMLCCLFGFQSILKEQKIPRLERSFTFWTLVAILCYAAGSFFIFFTREMLDDVDTIKSIHYFIYTNINLIRYVLLGVALYQKND